MDYPQPFHNFQMWKHVQLMFTYTSLALYTDLVRCAYKNELVESDTLSCHEENSPMQLALYSDL